MNRISFIKVSCLIYLLTGLLVACTSSTKELIKANPYFSLGNLFPYEPMDTVRVESPEGYELFYISHFGRHGSRFTTDSMDIHRPLVLFTEYSKKGILTDEGLQLLKDLSVLEELSRGNYGSLTTLGASEHKSIASRMVNHYPALFQCRHIDTYTTMVPRVIDSRDNFLLTIDSIQPGNDFVLNYLDDSPRNFQEVLGANMSKEQYKIIYSHDNLDKIVNNRWETFSGSTFARKIFTPENAPEDVKDVMNTLFNGVKSYKCINDPRLDFTRYFTLEELYELWWRNNMYWYAHHGYTEENEGIRPTVKGKAITQVIIEDADAVISNKADYSATLRFSHDGDMNALTCYLDIDGCNSDTYEDVEFLSRDFENVRAAVNIQLLFFRDSENNILVRILKNEKPVGLKNTDIPYLNGFYEWNTLKKYWSR